MLDRLLTLAKQGDDKAEKELFEYLFVRFKTLATRRIGRGDAEDIAQEASLTVLEKYKSETFSKGFEPWAYGVLRMKISNYMRGQLLRDKKTAPESEIDRHVQMSSRGSELDLKRKSIDCLREMIKRNRQYARVLNLVQQGYKTVEICQRLGIKPNNYYVTLSRGRRLLEICLETGGI